MSRPNAKRPTTPETDRDEKHREGEISKIPEGEGDDHR